MLCAINEENKNARIHVSAVVKDPPKQNNNNNKWKINHPKPQLAEVTDEEKQLVERWNSG